jgi:hypothetical protein
MANKFAKALVNQVGAKQQFKKGGSVANPGGAVMGNMKAGTVAKKADTEKWSKPMKRGGKVKK